MADDVVVFKETIGGERGLSGFVVRGEFYTGYSPQELADKLGIGKWTVSFLPKEKKRAKQNVRRSEADTEHFGY
jgi:hypothetical protein